MLTKVKKVFKVNNSCCPKCGAEEFITEPNQYDVLTFIDGRFDIRYSEGFDDYFRTFCRECDSEVDVIKSEEAKRIILLK